MSSEGAIAVAAAVTALVQVLKWAGVKDSWGPLLVILLSGAGVGIWLVSGESWPPARTDIWPIATGWINVTLATAGAFGFTRATAAAVTATREPPVGGAGASPTAKTLEERAKEIEREFPDGLKKESRP